MDEEGGVVKTLKIDPEFESLLVPLTQDELALLTQSVIEEGCRDSIIVWGGTILDGHNRYRICREHGIKFNTAVACVKDRNGAMCWIERNQLGRRNLTEAQTRLVRGRLYEREKVPDSEKWRGVSDQFDRRRRDRDTSERLGKQLGVSGPTIRRDAKLAREVDANPDVARRVMSGQLKSKRAVRAALGGCIRLTRAEPRAARIVLDGGSVEDVVIEGTMADDRSEPDPSDDLLALLTQLQSIITANRHTKKMKYINCTALTRHIREMRREIRNNRLGDDCNRCNGAGCMACNYTGRIPRGRIEE